MKDLLVFNGRSYRFKFKIGIDRAESEGYFLSEGQEDGTKNEFDKLQFVDVKIYVFSVTELTLLVCFVE